MARRIGGVLGAWMAAFWLVAAGPWASAQAAQPGPKGHVSRPEAKLPEGVKALRGVEFAKVGGHNFGQAQYERLVPIVIAFFDKHLKGAGAPLPAMRRGSPSGG